MAAQRGLRPEFETANGTGVCAEDLPACCRREADDAGEWDFECGSCGATWFRAVAVFDGPHGDADRKGAG